MFLENYGPVKRGHFKRKGSSSKHYFSGDMLVFGGVFFFVVWDIRLTVQKSYIPPGMYETL